MRIEGWIDTTRIKVIPVFAILPYFFYFLIIPLFVGCSKTSDNSSQKSSEYFPNKVGNSWEYQVTDSSDLREHSDIPPVYTVKVVITGTQKLLDGQTATVWAYEFPYGQELRFIVTSGDTIKVYDSLKVKDHRSLLFPNQILIIPFESNASWDGKLQFSDAYQVTQQDNVKNTFSNFGKGFVVYRHYQGPNTEYNDLMTFVANIGLVNADYIHYNFAPITRYRWALKKYTLH
jgi:hypothetical protein